MKNILSFIEETCRTYPDSIAVADEGSSYSYAELLENGKHIGSHLGKILQRNQPVVLFMDKTPSLVSAMLGVVYSGNFYVVADTSMPAERIRRIFETLRPAAILTDFAHEEKAKRFAGNILMISYETASLSPKEETLLTAIRKAMTESDPVYALYTSGSTGQPKGTILSHRAVIAYTEWFTKTFHIGHDTVFGSQTPFYFSMSVSDLFGTLRTGARLEIIPKKLFSFPLQLVDYMNTRKINTIYWVPSALAILANWDTFSYERPKYLKKVLFAGEVMPNKQLNYWRRHFPDLLYANLFGPTESTDICSYYIVDRPFDDGETLPIGFACDNCELLIVDENNREASQGELLIKGPFLANGYYNNPEKTAEVFVQNPLQSAYPEIVYRTGDLVKRSPSGELMYLGRKDFQIKHMGYRIELGEIEAALYAAEGVKSGVCIYDKEKDHIILIYEGDISKERLSKQISKKLPNYMHPSRILKVQALPHNANGKIDRSYLSAHYQELSCESSE